jgi:1-acyl-sn-glycerol-3-phosphate acyltransferase
MKAVSDTGEKELSESSPATVIVWLMNLWSYSLLFIWTLLSILLFPVAFVLGKLILRWSTERLVRWFIWVYGRVWLFYMSPFVRFERQDMDLLERDKPYLLVVNHFSFFDTFCMALLPIYNIAFAVRSWPFRMVWYRSFMRMARYLDVEGGSWEETLASSQETFVHGGCVLFFPEGHRSRDGQLQRFHSGGFQVAIAAGVPVVPLCIDGTNQLLPAGRKLMRPCRIRLRALPAIDTSNFSEVDGHIRLRKQVKEQMVKTLTAMRAGES